MWSFDSIRDTIRENARVARETAKAAAQVAQGVLQAAAAENDDQNQEQSQTGSADHGSVGNWDDWGSNQHDNAPPSHSTTSPLQDELLTSKNSQVPQPESFLPSPPPPPPPPPSSLTNTDSPVSFASVTGLPPRPNKQRRARSSRYVVTGVNTSPALTEADSWVPQSQTTVPTPQSNIELDLKCGKANKSNKSDDALPPQPQSPPSPQPPPPPLLQPQNTQLTFLSTPPPPPPPPPPSKMETVETEEGQKLLEDSPALAPSPPTSEQGSGPIPWNFQTNDWEEGNNASALDLELDPFHPSVEQNASETNDGELSEVDVLSQKHEGEKAAPTLEPQSNSFSSFVEQNTADTNDDELSGVGVLSQGHEGEKAAPTLKPQPNSFHSFAEQNTADTNDDKLSGVGVLPQSQEGDNHGTHIQSNDMPCGSQLLMDDFFSTRPQPTEGLTSRVIPELSVSTPATSPSAERSVSYKFGSEERNNTFDEESTDWFNKTATQLENISKSYEDSEPCTSTNLFSGSKCVSNESTENSRHENFGCEARLSSVPTCDYDSDASRLLVDLMEPVASGSAHIITDTNESVEDLPPVRAEPFTVKTDATKSTGSPRIAAPSSNINSPHANYNFCNADADYSSTEIGRETDGVEEGLESVQDDNGNVSKFAGFFSRGEGSITPDVETQVVGNAVPMDDVNWFSDMLSPEREIVANPFTEITQGTTTPRNECEVDGHVACAEILDRKAGHDPDAHWDDQATEESTLNDLPMLHPTAPLGHVTNPKSDCEGPSPTMDTDFRAEESHKDLALEKLPVACSANQKVDKGATQLENVELNRNTEIDRFRTTPDFSSDDVAGLSKTFKSVVSRNDGRSDAKNGFSGLNVESTGGETGAQKSEERATPSGPKQSMFVEFGGASVQEQGPPLEMKQSALENDQRTIDISLFEKDQEVAGRGALLKRVEELEELLWHSRSELDAKENEINQKLKVAETDAEIAKFERLKMKETCDALREEVSELHRSEQKHSRALASSLSKVKELELKLSSNVLCRDDNITRSAVTLEQLNEQMDRLKMVIDEKNSLFNEKERLQNEKDVLKAQLDELSKQLCDLQREVLNLTSERDELKSNCEGMSMQMKESQKSVEGVMIERDRLIRDRSMYNSASTSEREKALGAECEQRTRSLAIIQKKLTSATSKIEKLTAQRNTFQRQRDDAGARLRAAGAEFLSLNNRLSEANEAKEALQAQVLVITDERDKSLTKLQDLVLKEVELNVCQEDLQVKEKELGVIRNALMESQEQMQNIVEERSSLQNQCVTLKEELCSTLRACEVANRKTEYMESRIEEYEKDLHEMRTELQNLKRLNSESSSKIKELETNLEVSKVGELKALRIAEERIAKEQEERRDVENRLDAAEKKLYECNSSMEVIRGAITSSIDHGEVLLGDSPFNGGVELVWPNTLSLGEGHFDVKSAVVAFCEVMRILCEECAKSTQSRNELETMYLETNEKLQSTTNELQESRELSGQIENARYEANEARKELELLKADNVERDSCYAELNQQLQVALSKERDLLQQLSSLQEQFRMEREGLTARWNEEEARTEALDKVLSTLQSVWSMLENCIGEEQVQILEEELNQGEGSDSDRIGVIALRAAALVVAELNRKRAEASDMIRKLESADTEVARLTDRSELAEQERDALKGVVDRVERKASNAHSAGHEEARVQFEGIVTQLQDDLSELRDELRVAREKANRGEKETGELRGLCNKLTSQLNGRTNELDEAEEKLAYLQDQVSTLEEDLHEAHRRLKQAEEESAESRRFDVEKLSHELDKRCAELETAEKECVRLREACDEAEQKAKVFEVEAKTHQQAEANLQIAIEQLEAEQESAVEQRTISLEKKVRDSEMAMKEANERAKVAIVSENQLKLRDDEIKELRGALGKLADERVELKLELEKSLSRLHHPDTEEQLVDRRVVRQLLISYFRVDSVRRRDVLQLMSRMLAFSESDNVAVGLKRRALMDRLGSLVQAPELNDASLPPLGTVSDKWIEFLMKEAEEGEDQERRW